MHKQASRISLQTMGAAVAITGASGFVGQSLVAALPQAKVLDRSQHQLETPGSLKSFLKGVKVIFHLAGINAGSGYTPSNEALVSNNVIATQNLLEGLRRYNQQIPLIVLLSSVHVYGKVQDKLNEQSARIPASFYGLTKLMQEVLLEQAARMGVIKRCILRVSNIYGSDCRPYYNSAVATFCAKIRKHEELEAYGGGKSELDLVHVDDVVSILLKVSILANSKEPIYNLSFGKSVTVNQVIKVLSKVSQINPRVRVLNNEPVRIRVDNNKLLSKLRGFELLDLNQGMQRTWGSLL